MFVQKKDPRLSQKFQFVSLVRNIVQPPLLKLDLQGLNAYFLAPKISENGDDEWLLRTVLANFAGVELKLKNFEPLRSQPMSSIDFEWACTPTLKYFKLDTVQSIDIAQIRVIAKRLAAMPQLKKVKIIKVNIMADKSKESTGYKMFSSFFSKADKQDTKTRPNANWLEPLQESRSLFALVLKQNQLVDDKISNINFNSANILHVLTPYIGKNLLRLDLLKIEPTELIPTCRLCKIGPFGDQLDLGIGEIYDFRATILEQMEIVKLLNKD